MYSNRVWYIFSPYFLKKGKLVSIMYKILYINLPLNDIRCISICIYIRHNKMNEKNVHTSGSS